MSIALAFLIAFSFLFCLRAALGTEYPLLVVSSGSMLPTLNIGDMIVVQSIDPSKIHADELAGDIVVFRSPVNPNELIVHRAIRTYNDTNGRYMIVTSGDAFKGMDTFSPWDASLLVGKVVMRISYIGNLTLLLNSGKGIFTIMILMIVAILATLMLLTDLNQEEEPKKVGEKRKQENTKHLAYMIAVNILIISFMLFSLWGSFTFWQPGAAEPKYVTILGMYRDLQLHESGNNIEKAFLSQGFLTYRIDCQLTNGGIRLGVPTFSWFQLSLLALIIFDGWKILNPLIQTRRKERKSASKAEDS